MKKTLIQLIQEIAISNGKGSTTNIQELTDIYNKRFNTQLSVDDVDTAINELINDRIVELTLFPQFEEAFFTIGTK